MVQQTKLTLSVIKVDIGSVAGHNRPHLDLFKHAKASFAAPGGQAQYNYTKCIITGFPKHLPFGKV